MATNFGVINIRANRECSICGGRIEKGNQALTINKMNSGRKWCHIKCYSDMEKEMMIRFAEDDAFGIGQD